MGRELAQRPIRIEGEVAYVPLTKGYEAIIDAEDVPAVSSYSWSAMVAGKNVYAVTSVKGDTLYMRRLFVKPAQGRRVKARGNSLDCRKASLGIAGELSEVKQKRARK